MQKILCFHGCMNGWMDGWRHIHTYLKYKNIHKNNKQQIQLVVAYREESTKGFTCIAVFLEYIKQCGKY